MTGTATSTHLWPIRERLDHQQLRRTMTDANDQVTAIYQHEFPGLVNLGGRLCRRPQQPSTEPLDWRDEVTHSGRRGRLLEGWVHPDGRPVGDQGVRGDCVGAAH